MHLVRLHEQASRERPQAYRRRVLLFAVLGYAAVLALGLLALGGLVWLGVRVQHGQVRGWMAWVTLACLGLLWATLTGLRVPFEPPEGEPLTAEDAPELFKGLERIRQKVQGPPIHAVLVSGDFNASIMQQPRWLGLSHRNYLVLGWPMLAALEPRRLYAVIAHEYGHLRGNHGKLSAWIYRSRRAWAGIGQRYSEDESLIGVAMGGFINWYFPRFSALSFALARQDEYEADRVSARILGPQLAAQTLQEIALKAPLHAQDFWRGWWKRALEEPAEGRPAPHLHMAQSLQAPIEPARMQQVLRAAYRRLPSLDDTHPVLKDRVNALAQPMVAPTLSRKSALGLLGRARGRIGAALDDQWWQASRHDWAAHGERLRALQADIQRFEAAPRDTLSADDWLRWAEAIDALSDRDPTPWLERVLQMAPRHEQALLRLARRHAPLADARVGLWLEQAWQHHDTAAWQAAQLAVDWLSSCQADGHPLPAEQQQLWRERLAQSEAMEQAAWNLFSDTSCWENTQPVRLDAEQLRALRGPLLRLRDVQAAWLCNQALAVKPAREHHTLWLQARPGLGKGAAIELAQRVFDAMDLPGRCRVVLVGVQVEAARVDNTPHLLPLMQRRA